MYRSPDEGKTWDRVADVPTETVVDMVLHPFDSKMVRHDWVTLSIYCKLIFHDLTKKNPISIFFCTYITGLHPHKEQDPLQDQGPWRDLDKV